MLRRTSAAVLAIFLGASLTACTFTVEFPNKSSTDTVTESINIVEESIKNKLTTIDPRIVDVAKLDFISNNNYGKAVMVSLVVDGEEPISGEIVKYVIYSVLPGNSVVSPDVLFLNGKTMDGVAVDFYSEGKNFLPSNSSPLDNGGIIVSELQNIV